MSAIPLRRSQLIAPFGPGTMMVGPDGVCVICAGLDDWFETDYDTKRDINEFKVYEWRLQRWLGVSHFRLPPEFRERNSADDTYNCKLYMPFYRFPTWHYCPSCGTLKKLPLTVRGIIKCDDCKGKGKTSYLIQVPFVAMCENGHLQDFPWREWVHRSNEPKCHGKMKLYATGGATLSGQILRCECGAYRSLYGVTEIYSSNGTTFLSSQLEEDGEDYLCKGRRPWLGLENNSQCGAHLSGALRSASNVYYAHIRSSIYLPQGKDDKVDELIRLMQKTKLSSTIKTFLEFSGGDYKRIKPIHLRNQDEMLLKPYRDEEITAAIQVIAGGGDMDKSDKVDYSESQETRFRREEYEVLKTQRDESYLKIRQMNVESYDVEISRFFSRIALVERLRETRVLEGFSRIYPEPTIDRLDSQELLWRSPPKRSGSWLPAYVVYGEGIFFELNERVFDSWIRKFGGDVFKRLNPLIEKYENLKERRRLKSRPIGPRFILIHTLAHLLMNRLTYECGYSSASLRERLYVSDSEESMSGLLIYTAAGDSEGTLGGLVRMGRPGNLESIMRRAIERAAWCSTDPVCMEIGGQGLDSCNLAACHNCAMVPETACEEFNRFLDRGVVVGNFENRDMGFFSPLLQYR